MREFYSVGDKGSAGEEITEIFGDTGNIAIFRTAKGIRWEIRSGPEFSDVVFERYHRLLNSLPSSCSKITSKSVHDQLCASLFNSLTSSSQEKATQAFEHVEDRISSIRTPNQTRLYFFSLLILVSLIFSGLIGTFIDIENAINKSIALCAICGVIGSVLSTLQRSTKFEIADDEEIKFIAFQAVIISVVGLLSGVAIYIVANSGIAFSFAKNDMYNLMTISLVSGFAERFIPDLFSQIGKQQ